MNAKMIRRTVDEWETTPARVHPAFTAVLLEEAGILLRLFAEFAAAMARSVLAVDFLRGAPVVAPLVASRLRLGRDFFDTIVRSVRSRSTRRRKGLGRFSSSDGS